MPATEHSSRLQALWRKYVLDVIVAQLTQGVTPEKIALTVALGLTLGIFPILGTTTLLCAVAALWLRLNQPVIQVVNYLAYPAQLPLIFVFIRIGEWLLNAPHVSLSLSEMLRKFHESPAKFLQEFGLTGLHGILAWLLTAPFLAAVIYFLLLPALKKAARLKNAK